MSTALVHIGPKDRPDRLPASAFRRRWTHAQACAELPETSLPIEIWDGELIISPTPFFLHQHVIAHFYRALDSWVRKRKAGVTVLSPMDVVLAEDLVLQPDVMFIAKERTRIIQRHVMGAPDLAVEVVSPGRRKRDYKDKRDRYDAHGVREYWIIDPGQQQIEVWSRNADADDRLVLHGRYIGRQLAPSQLLPGFKVRVDQMLSASLDN